MTDSIAWISAGSFNRDTKLDIPNWGAAVVTAQAYGTLAVNTHLCRPAQTLIPLTAQTLEGGAVAQLNEEFDCEAPRRVLLRVRATSTSEIRLTRDRQFLKARTGFGAAYVAVRTPTGRPLLFATVADSGKARIFVAPRSCSPD
jgi:hypothetical protein